MTVEELAECIRQAGYQVVQRGNSIRSQCPAHGGQDLNLGLKTNDLGGVTITCFSHGCDDRAIVRALGLSITDLMPEKITRSGGSGGLPRIPGTVVARYRYTDERGELLFETWRYEPKDFRPAYVTPEGSWKTGLPSNIPRVLYRLPELQKADPKEPIFLAAGEKDADNLAKLGLIATTNPLGENQKWAHNPQWIEPLRGHYVVILEDHDAMDPIRHVRPGEQHSKEVFAVLTGADIRCKRLLLPGLAEGEDVSDWIQAGGTAAMLRQLAQADPEPPNTEFDALVYDGPGLAVADIPEPDWLAPGLVARAVMTMLVGIGKLGKSVLAHQLCVANSVGGVWLGQRLGEERCLYCNFEDPLGLTRQRAIQQFHPIDLPANYRTIEPPWEAPLSRFLAWLKSYIEREQITLVVIDPLAIAAKWKDENDNMEVGLTCRQIQEVAKQTGAAILVVHHARKSGGEYGTEVRGGGAIFAGIQGFLSFKRIGEGQYQLDTLDKMPGELGGEKRLLLRREAHTLTWHVEAAEGMAAVASLDYRHQFVLEIVRNHPEGIVAGEIITRTPGYSKESVYRYLRRLESLSLIRSERLEVGGTGAATARTYYPTSGESGLN